MTAASVLGPFRPGAGAMPPYLAGRGAEQRLLGALLRDLEAGTPPAGDVILYGPRGNGGGGIPRDLMARRLGAPVSDRHAARRAATTYCPRA